MTFPSSGSRDRQPRVLGSAVGDRRTAVEAYVREGTVMCRRCGGHILVEPDASPGTWNVAIERVEVRGGVCTMARHAACPRGGGRPDH